MARVAGLWGDIRCARNYFRLATEPVLERDQRLAVIALCGWTAFEMASFPDN